MDPMASSWLFSWLQISFLVCYTDSTFSIHQWNIVIPQYFISRRLIFFLFQLLIAQGWYHQWLVWLSLIWWTPKANTFPNTNHCQVHISEWDISRTSHILYAESEIMLSVQAISSLRVKCFLIKVNVVPVACKVLHGQDLPYFLTSSQIPYLSSS